MEEKPNTTVVHRNPVHNPVHTRRAPNLRVPEETGSDPVDPHAMERFYADLVVKLSWAVALTALALAGIAIAASLAR